MSKPKLKPEVKDATSLTNNHLQILLNSKNHFFTLNQESIYYSHLEEPAAI